jgi:23S rRNA (pseudouridine1915-N3)-methyltransferase
MKVTLIQVGKTVSKDIRAITDDYSKRVNRYTRFEEVVIDNGSIKLQDANKVKEKEGELIMKKLNPTDYVMLLDEKGKEYTSVEFAGLIEQLTNQSTKNLCLVIGGAYGFSNEVYKRANAKLSLSQMTFSHQIIRAIFMEQLYRAYTIINGEPYHHA